MKQIKKIIITTIVLVMMMSYAVFAGENEDIVYDENDFGYTNIIIKGEDNIKAYEDAGLIKKCNAVQADGADENIITRGTVIPSIVYNLSRGAKIISWEFTNYMYSNYIYNPAPDSLSSTGYGIYHRLNPNRSQVMTIEFYNTNNAREYRSTYTVDDVTTIGTAVKAKNYYIKYISTDGVKIAGSGSVY